MARRRRGSVFSPGGPSTGRAPGLARILLVVLAAVVLGGLIFLGFWEFEAPTATVEKEIPSEQPQR